MVAVIAVLGLVYWTSIALAKCASDDAFRVAMERLASIESRGTSALRVILDVDPGSLL